MKLRTRVEGGGTPRTERWGVDSEYGRLRDVLVGPIDHFSWQAGNAVAQRSERVGLQFDFNVARAQYREMLDVYRQADVAVHVLPAEPELPYQIFARDSSAMTPWGALIMQPQKAYRRGEYAACLQFYLDTGIPIYDFLTAGNAEGGDFMVLIPGSRFADSPASDPSSPRYASFSRGSRPKAGRCIAMRSIRIFCTWTCRWA